MNLLGKLIGLDDLNKSSRALASAASRPIPVQPYPLIDDVRFEKEKQALACEAARQFGAIGQEFMQKLSHAHSPVLQKSEKFFAHIENADNSGSKKALNRALKELLDCSPKRVIAAFQANSLEAGVAFVGVYNRLIDDLATRYPRCRSGIYASRLNYSDAIQVSEEVIATLRTTSTVLDDVQRRFDLLESLVGQLSSDLSSTEIQTIWDAAKNSFNDSVRGLADDEAGWLKQTLGISVGALSWAHAVMSVPQAQFQGQLARSHRIKVFIATSLLLRHGWAEWTRLNERVVTPGLKVMFALKADFAANRIISITDLINANGYSLEELPRTTDALVIKET